MEKGPKLIAAPGFMVYDSVVVLLVSVCFTSLESVNSAQIICYRSHIALLFRIGFKSELRPFLVTFISRNKSCTLLAATD